MKIMINYKCK